MRLGLISLGCDKNTVDSERMLAELVGHGAERTAVDEAEVILVNTCGFIDAAKEESIETILEAERLKREGACRSVVAVGCMVERYREEMAEALPEVDLLLGLRDLDRLVPELRERGLLQGPAPAGGAHPGERIPVGARHVRYLKVSEGCSHTCAFCAIPLWRGKHRSFELERLVAEAQRLEAQGAVEVNLVAQDLAHWGREQRDGTDIATLVEALLRETSIPWFRLLYIYSAGLRESLVELMASEPRLLSYIDMPIQHASDTVLHRMRRPERAATLRSKVVWLRETIPELTLRTTVLVGFPGETDAEFRELVNFLDQVPFDRLGAFAFSPQEGTRAAAMEESFVPADLARDRLEEVLEVQRAVSRERLAAEIGRERVAVVDAPAAPDEPTLELLYENPPRAAHLGRIESQADDVDGVTVLVGGNGLAPGSLVRVEIQRAADFDLAGRVREVVLEASEPGRAAPAPTPQPGRGLPVLGLDSAWGR
ncbi:30S ribosomal protein S12 methylthiotransferase RimO [Candidatus Palauibacter sp.]|uniref:30S ribosomal protein S12 methylthiotransferase RimO n=1 Tax=Candidatus Palauibacter sp. TaxID=3101350 RepID=UPI003D10FF60